MTTPPSKPLGRSLNDFGELLPAEKLLRDAVRVGKPAVIAKERPSKSTPENEIRAGFLRFLALGGNEYAPVHERGVQIVGAWISTSLDLIADEINGNLEIKNSHFERAPCFYDTNIKGTLTLTGSLLPGLRGDRLKAIGAVLLNDIEANGKVCFLGAKIGGDFSCQGGKFSSKNDDALVLNRAEVAGKVFLSENFHADGTVSLQGANIASDLVCNGGKFGCQNNNAISANGVKIAGNTLLNNNFSANGKVCFLGAKISGDFSCQGGKFSSKNDDALVLNRAEVAGKVFLSNDFHADGTVSLQRVNIGSDLVCNGGKFGCDNGNAISANQARVGGEFLFKGITIPVTRIDLSGAKVGALNDDMQSWGNELILDGFVYQRLSQDATCDAAERIVWLKKQPTDHCNNPNDFKPHPWQQLIATFRAMGHKTAANQIAIEREKHLRKIGKVGETPPEWGAWKTTLYRVVSISLHWLFGTLMAYGYRPIKLAAWMILVWLVSGVLFWWAALSGVFAPSNPLVFDHPKYQHCSPTDAPASPTKENLTLVHCFTEMQSNSLQALTCQCSKSLSCLAESSPPKEKFGNWYLCPELASEYTGFSPFTYSLDLILPLVDLQQEHDWAPYIPTPKATWHEELRQFLHPTDWKYHWTRLLVWFEILFGWVASLLLVAVVSGLTNRDKDD